MQQPQIQRPVFDLAFEVGIEIPDRRVVLSKLLHHRVELPGQYVDLIISGGFNIYPREIEEFLGEQPGVKEVVVAGLNDARRGEVPVAYIVADGELDAASLEAACREHLASFKVPRAFVQVPSLPRTALGKIQKHLLPPLS